MYTCKKMKGCPVKDGTGHCEFFKKTQKYIKEVRFYSCKVNVKKIQSNIKVIRWKKKQ